MLIGGRLNFESAFLKEMISEINPASAEFWDGENPAGAEFWKEQV